MAGLNMPFGAESELAMTVLEDAESYWLATNTRHHVTESCRIPSISKHLLPRDHGVM